MPQIVEQPAPRRRTATRPITTTPHKQSSLKLTINDDRGEKAARLQSRHALQEIQMNEIRAAASPMRKLNQKARPCDSDVSVSSPQTPRRSSSGGKKRTVAIQQTIPLRGSPTNLEARNPNSSMTPMKRVPILANFEEWMKLATDNKINATNSWNFALIDYFHDMSLLKEGDGVNFQKASCTLDGCVKIYTSRVDSVATETGRLLSGLADNGEDGKKKRAKGDGDGEDEDGEEGDEDDEEGDDKKNTKRKANRSHEATLAPSFASLQLKKMELEFAVDPLFKKASADFDEGGAKGLLLNHLSIDSEGRIVFDSSDDAGDAGMAGESTQVQQPEEEQDANQLDLDQDSKKGSDKISQEDVEEADQEIDLEALGLKFFPDLSMLDNQDICPSMKTFTIGDPSSDLSIPLLKAPDDWREAQKAKANVAPPTLLDPNLNLADQSGFFLGDNDAGFDDEDDGGLLGGFDMAENVGFGEGGEVWAKEAAVEPMMRDAQVEEGNLDDNLIDGENADGYAISLQHRYREDAEQEGIMAYFDKAFNSRAKVGTKAFQSLENWRIQRIQKQAESAANPSTRQRKEKEPFEIDFMGTMSDSLKKLLRTEPANNSSISLPRTQAKTKGRNLLDKDDEMIDVKSMMRLWIKPKCRIGRRRGGMEVIDEGFGARERGSNPVRTTDEDNEDDDGKKGDYDANFFADDEPLGLPFDGPLPIDDDDFDDDGMGGGDNDGGDNPGFVDAREMLSPGPANDGSQPLHTSQNDLADPSTDSQTQQPSSQFPVPSDLLPGSFGSQLVTQQGRRMRPEYVNYARTAKKVDVRALKENMWKGMSDRLIDALGFAADHDRENRLPTPALTDGDGDTDMMDVDEPPPPPSASEVQDLNDKISSEEGLKFTDILTGLKSFYPEQQMKDISTSYGFICLLHLANEKGLMLEGGREDGAMNEIRVRRDPGVGEGYVGE